MWENNWEKYDNFDKKWEVWEKVSYAKKLEDFEKYDKCGEHKKKLDVVEKLKEMW